MSTPMATERLDADLQGTPTNQMTYRRMIGGLMYLTASRPDIAYATFVCARYQARPTVKHLILEDVNEDDCKSTSGGLQFLEYQLADLFTKALPKERFEYLVHRIDVPLTQSQPTESTQGTHRTPSAPRSPNPKMDTAESSAPTVICFCLLERRSTRLTPPALMPTVDKADKMILQDTLQYLASEEIEKMMEGLENVIDDSLHPRNDEPNILGTRLEPMSDKESPEVEITNDEEVEITNVVIPVNVNEDEEEITDEVYELKLKEKGKIVKESRSTQFPTPIRSPRIHTDLVSSDTEKFQELTITDTKTTPSSRSPNTNLSKTNRLLSLSKAKPAHFK
ncbi:hypothetical protein Tco_0835546 [Tanacetum coccineum]